MEKLELINDLAVKNDIALVYIFGSRVKTGLDILMERRRKTMTRWLI
ncbi:MAG: hypothetical protein AB1815_08465 [Bacillota bacterium]